MAPTTISTDTAHRRMAAIAAAKQAAGRAKFGHARCSFSFNTQRPGVQSMMLFASRQEGLLWLFQRTTSVGGGDLWASMTEESKAAMGELETCDIHLSHPLTPVVPGEAGLHCTECIHDHDATS